MACARALGVRDGSIAGYTYVGLLLLLAIMSLAAALTLNAASLLQQRSNEEELLFIGHQFAEAFRSYFESSPAGNRQFPARLEDLLKDPRYPGTKRHLRRIYPDPMTGRTWALVVAPGGGIMGVHSVSERAPIKVANFEPPFEGLAAKKRYSDWIFGFYPPIVSPPPGPVAPIGKPFASPATGTGAPARAP
jgi:type II secretory pathway pseudopilin PulG